MKNFTLLCLLMATLFACTPKTTEVLTEKSPPPKVTNEKPEMTTPEPMPTFSGRWTITSVQAFAPPGSLPEYKEGDIIWDFNKTHDNYGEVLITNNTAKEGEKSENKSQFWVGDCIVKIGSALYKYEFSVSSMSNSENPTPPGEYSDAFMYLKDNLDPSLPDGGQTLVLKKM